MIIPSKCSLSGSGRYSRSAKFDTTSELIMFTESAVQYAERVLYRIYKLIQLYRRLPCGVSPSRMHLPFELIPQSPRLYQEPR